ncbi:hypothetical protein MKEN_00200100 [Mycena kentingensis (nom. inval.)]|nr:hypothetical protein MKEN_00200100 [Mycena kentingensis (nom. inval.)]
MRFTASLIAAVFTLVAFKVNKAHADIIAFDGDACNGNAGGNAPCDGSCVPFDGRHSFEIVSGSGHTVILFENDGCSGEQFNFGFENPGACVNVNTGTPIGSFTCF